VAAGAGFQCFEHSRLSAVNQRVNIFGVGDNRHTDVGGRQEVTFKFFAEDISSLVLGYITTIDIEIIGGVRLFGFVVNVREES
jgi:predicted GH43/DUF377 family glycosyl hydrolase